jgi:excisionase family DNA binding protein
MTMTNKLWTVREVCQYFEISRATLHRYVKKGLPSFHVGGSPRFDQEKVAEWLNRQAQKTPIEKAAEDLGISLENHFTEQELQEYLGISHTTLHRFKKQGLPYFKHMKFVFYSKEAVFQWIEEQVHNEKNDEVKK